MYSFVDKELKIKYMSACLLTFPIFCMAQVNEKGSEKPNVLFICIDDLRDVTRKKFDERTDCNKANGLLLVILKMLKLIGLH